MIKFVRLPEKFNRCHWYPLSRCHGAAVRWACLCSSLSLLSLFSCGQAAKAEDYLLQIEAAAKRQAATPIQATAVPNTLDATERLPLGLPQEAFEKSLHDQFLDTYVFYQRLNSEDKVKIFEIYKQDNRVSIIREQTLKLLSSGTP
jgi:hypothetical protein